MSKRVNLSIKAAVILFVTAGLVGLVVLRNVRDLDFSLYALSLSVPLLASALLAFVSALVPTLATEPRIKFPMNLTFPLIHCFLMLVVVRLALTTPNALESLPPKLGVATIWQHWPVLAVCGVFGVFVLSAAGAIGKGE